mmetsp:Transcript_96179/g.161700  ORF Transcript_96179/g.161700 Transcript_96179/m.161700 type:complete len:82 (-) Transcript_96179:287-532(-)
MEVPEWDRTAADCALWQASFGVFRHRHWCRQCKRTICGSCCARRSRRGYGRVNPDNACKECKKVQCTSLPQAPATALMEYP